MIDGGHVAQIAAACDLLTADARALFDAEGDCPGTLGFLLFDEEVESYPDLRSIAVRDVRVIHRQPTVARVDLVYRFKPKHSWEPRVVRWSTRVALAREPGSWRLADPGLFSPRAAVRGDPKRTIEQIRRDLERVHRLAERVRARALRRLAATRPLVTGAARCPGEVRRARDTAREVTGEDGERVRGQDSAGVDLIQGGQSLVGNRVCFELRFRTPLAQQATLVLRLAQPGRHGGSVDAVNVEIHGNGAVASRDVEAGWLGPPPFAPVAVVSADRTAISVDIRASRGWPGIQPAQPYTWRVEAWSVVPTGAGVYFDELQP
jgi:hypothetical protein